MPMYDFSCECGKKFEALARMDERQKECSCGKLAERVMASPWLRIDVNSERWVNRHKPRRTR